LFTTHDDVPRSRAGIWELNGQETVKMYPDGNIWRRASPAGSERSRAGTFCKWPRQKLLRLEIPQIGWRLALADRHQGAVAAHHVVLGADPHMDVALGAGVVCPQHLLLAAEVLGRRPRLGERAIGGGHLEVQQVRVSLVEVEPLLDDGGIVLGRRNPGF